ncbi:unnamed protein product [Cunninghamella blakesleeana]
MSLFLKIYKEADDKAHDSVEEELFPKFITAAVGEFKCGLGLGVELEEDLIELSRELADKYYDNEEENCHNKHNITFIQGDLLKTLKDGVEKALSIKEEEKEEKEQDWLPWNVIIICLLPEHSHLFADDLKVLYRRGAKIISLLFNLNEIEEFELRESDEPSNIYVYSKDPL